MDFVIRCTVDTALEKIGLRGKWGAPTGSVFETLTWNCTIFDNVGAVAGTAVRVTVFVMRKEPSQSNLR